MTTKVPPITRSLGFGLHPQPTSTKPAPESQDEPKARILLVDNDPESRRFMNVRLASSNYAVEVVETARGALEACTRSRPNLVISDLRLDGDLDGLDLLKELKSRWPLLTVIIITAHGTIADAVRATQYGAFGFLVKPIEKSELLGQVERAIAASSYRLLEGDWRFGIVARSHLMEERLQLANRAAAGDAPVLLTGENGTGKELLARAIHAASSRREKPFLIVHCERDDETALEAELFGGPRPRDVAREEPSGGALADARGGTLLLVEISALSLKLQVRLITALTGPTRGADVRVICTTTRELNRLIRTGAFRQDLFYYINVLPIEIPPLGRRREDIPLLVSHFLEQATETDGRRKLYSPDAIELLATTDWPGNVRQLFELVKQNVALSHGKIMSKEFVARSLGNQVKRVPTYDEARDEFARSYLTHNLQATAGNVSQSARLAKRNRTDFYKLLARYRIEPDDFKNASPGGGKKRGASE